MDFKTKKILVTGGASGIGKELVLHLIDKGAAYIALVGRRKEPMEDLAASHPNIEWLVLPADLGDPKGVNEVAQSIEKEWGQLDILINNAGVVSASPLEDVPDQDIVNQININVTGVILLTQKMFPLLKQSKEAAIINVSSGLGYIARPFYSVYAATKAAVRQFSDALRRELKEHPIHVMTIYPTATDTPMMETIARSGMDNPTMVAKKSIEGLEARQINVIFGGEQRFKDIQENFNDPLAMDQKLTKDLSGAREKSKHHQAM